MKRVLVAGASGYLGGFVAREFKARGYLVRALVRSPERLGSLADELDEVAVGEITRPETLEGVCDGVDIVFSSVGITRQKDGLTFQDVDFRGNMNLLEEALASSVRKFVYVSVFQGPQLLHLDIVKAHEDFVKALEASGIDWSVVRPTGFFSDMVDYLKMARKGRVYLFGSGRNRINPIHGADLAEVCVEAAQPGTRQIDVGGPEVLTHLQIAEMALAVLGRPRRISSVPLWIMKPIIGLVRVFDRHRGELLAFLTTAMSLDAVAPRTGSHLLEAEFRRLAREERTQTDGSRLQVGSPVPGEGKDGSA